uniref:Uncharacterized protein n=1 Tax=Avena sativa TaxID=4498 RepID=A0ACD5YGI9_AVESA
MGSCTSRSPAPAPASAPASGSSGRRAATAKVVGLDGSMAQYAAPATARHALRDDGSSSSSVFLCSSDELRLDQPPRVLADEEALQPGWLYFVLPVSTLRLALSKHEMTVLAVRASYALAVASGVASPPRRKAGTRRMSAANGKQRRTARVAPLAVADEDPELADGGSSQHAYGGDVKAGKLARKGAGSYRIRGGARHRRRAVGVQRLSAILEADEYVVS